MSQSFYGYMRLGVRALMKMWECTLRDEVERNGFHFLKNVVNESRIRMGGNKSTVGS